MTIQALEGPWTGNLFSDGWRPGSGTPIDVTAVASGRALGSVGSATTEDLDRAVESAHAAQKQWAALTYDQRAAVMLAAARLLEDEPSALNDWIVEESGSGVGKAGFEVGLVISELQEAAAVASHPYG